MPQWISKDGEWFPKNEKVALVRPDGEPFVYEGPDREALKYLRDNNVDKLGTHFMEDSDTIAFVRQKYGLEIKEYAKSKGWSPEKTEAKFKEESSKVNFHTNPKPNQPIKPKSGGENMAQTKTVESLSGGFGEANKVRK